tara:strand:- start:679 stop:1659 length:981 start_codon:yes stop_codon:yes gene_type:complete
MSLHKVAGSLILVLLIVVIGWFTYPQNSDVETAFVRGELILFSAQHPGIVDYLNCNEGQHIKKGDVIASLRSDLVSDTEADVESALKKESKYLAAMGFELESLSSQVVFLEKSILLTEEQVKLAKQRNGIINENHGISIEDKTESALRLKDYQHDLVRKSRDLESLRAKIKELNSTIELQRGYVSTLDGRKNLWTSSKEALTLKSAYSMHVMRQYVLEGSGVEPGDPLCQGVIPGSLWVDAYLTNEQLDSVIADDKKLVFISSGETKVKGSIIAISPATGAALSPTTPNYTSGHVLPLIQRTPVRISLPLEAQNKWRVGQRVKVML